MKTINHKFVEFIPTQNEMEDGVIYVSLEYDTAVHNCICGCGQKVVTPLSPTDWKLTYNGESVSLYPSIGNWNFECQSHYWIKNGKIVHAEPWSEAQIESNRKNDSTIKRKLFDTETDSKIDQNTAKQTNGFIPRIIDLVKKWFSN